MFSTYFDAIFFTYSAVKQTGVGAVSGCCPRGDCEAKEQVCSRLSSVIVCSSTFVLCSFSHRSVNALKDREDRYRVYLNRQFETLSDAKNIEEQV
jgi:hypothetical protein